MKFSKNNIHNNNKYFFDNAYGDYVRSHPKRTMLGVAAIFLVVMASAFYFELTKLINEDLNKEWESQQPAYDVKNEYWTLYYAGGLKSRLLNKYNWSDNNFLIKYLDSLSKDAYESAKDKIPANDGEILLFEYMYKIGNFMPSTEERIKPITQDIYSLYEKLINPDLDIKNQFMKTEYRYYALDSLSLGIIRMFNIFDIDNKKDLAQNFIEKHEKFLNSDAGKFLYQRGYISESQDRLSISMHVKLFEILKARILTRKDNKVSLQYGCNDRLNLKNIKRFGKIIAKINDDILPKYKNNISNYSDKMESYINYIHEKITSFKKDANLILESDCKITL